MIFARLLLMAALAASAAPATAQVRFHGEAAGASIQVMSWREIPFRTVVRQQHDFSCGSAALATLLTYHYGRPTTEPGAFKAMYAKGDQAKIRKVGFSMLDMKHYLEALGMPAQGYRMTFEGLAARTAPSIVLIDLGSYRHFVVVKGVAGGKVLVGDPAMGLKTYSRQEFIKIWKGTVFALEDAPGRQPIFNQRAEWSPWAVAPVGAIPSDSLAALTAGVSPFYQISPATLFDSPL